MVRNQ
jgi:hypothetical protein